LDLWCIHGELVARPYHRNGTNQGRLVYTAIMDPVDTTDASAHAAFHDLALPWLRQVARYARLLTQNQADADDLTQETFLEVPR
jgi:hypothetical protein